MPILHHNFLFVNENFFIFCISAEKIGRFFSYFHFRPLHFHIYLLFLKIIFIFPKKEKTVLTPSENGFHV